MDREKQIEEMARTLCSDYQKRCDTCEYAEWCDVGTDSAVLYDAGYRKQREGQWIDKPAIRNIRMQSWCSACGKHSGIGGIESNRHKPFCPNCGAKMKGE